MPESNEPARHLQETPTVPHLDSTNNRIDHNVKKMSLSSPKRLGSPMQALEIHILCPSQWKCSYVAMYSTDFSFTDMADHKAVMSSDPGRSANSGNINRLAIQDPNQSVTCPKELRMDAHAM